MAHHNPLWLFDLDDTLHDASHAIFPAVIERMNVYLARVLGGTQEQVEAARLDYWKRYGATLLGMVKHHDVSAEHFLRETHDIPELEQLVRFERGLRQLLRRLPGEKILLTNGPLHYSRKVLRLLRLQRHFSRHIAIESMQVRGQWHPKPSKLMLRRLLLRHGVPARRCVLVEDSLPNLRAAKAVGMRTAWITQYGDAGRKNPPYVDVKVKSVRQLPAQLRRLR